MPQQPVKMKVSDPLLVMVVVVVAELPTVMDSTLRSYSSEKNPVGAHPTIATPELVNVSGPSAEILNKAQGTPSKAVAKHEQ